MSHFFVRLRHDAAAPCRLKIGSGIQGYTGGGGGVGDPGVAVFQVQRRHSYGMFPVKLFGNMPSSSNASPHGSNQQ